MAFFVRYKKVKKSPSQPSKDRKREQKRSTAAPPNPAPQGWQPGPGSPHQLALPFQPAGLLPAPAGWNGGPSAPPAYAQPGTYPPIIVNQHHYYLGAPPPLPPRPDASIATTPSPPSGKLHLETAVDLAKDLYQGLPHWLGDVLPSWHASGTQLVQQGNCLVTEISHRFDNVLTAIDQGAYNGREHDIYAWQPGDAITPSASSQAATATETKKKAHSKTEKKPSKRHASKSPTSAPARGGSSGGLFAKVDLYANSKLPMDLPPLKLYIPTYPLLCLAAQYSERVYEPPSSQAERDTHINASWFSGTKTMVIKSVPMDYMNTIVFAIRGTATFMDWAVNLDTTPTSPRGFLDDHNNLCHAGFLSVARNMVGPVARRLRQLLEEDPGRASHSLLITGHSAGGAIAALLYAHMLAATPEAESELTAVAGCFKRVHCVTFGAPPVSVKPIVKPADEEGRRPQLRKSVFLAFVNEGDPVTRADRGYVRSLLELFAAPAPKSKPVATSVVKMPESKRSRKPSSSTMTMTTTTAEKAKAKAKAKPSSPPSPSSSSPEPTKKPTWPVPDCTLSLAGRIVVLRSGDPGRVKTAKKSRTVEERLGEGAIAQVVTDAQLRGVLWGDPVAHMMRLYAGRVELLAVGAVTARGY
ncbi:hypothetical protein VTJ83DRAFT_3754 [Remersonia thermophila]|uniref:Fungal lipase-type domain-containing protein n=1 Tax=Remersonia thermophila TaxID=72144 RepID=A0ABR4DEX2_9PEZI